MSDNLLKLAERVEVATGPDRRLDAEIGAAVRQMPKTDPGAWISGWSQPFIAAPQFVGSIAAPDSKGNIVCHWEAREFTASLDAAMSLVPEGWGFEVGTDHGQPRATIWDPQSLEWTGDEVRGETPALALTAAALRARHHQEQSNG